MEMEKTSTENEIQNDGQTMSGAKLETKKPVVYDYTDYREFLKDSFEFLRSKNPAFSATAFVKRAGFGENSRGYLNLLLNKKRNLSSKTILGFSQALKLEEKESFYFENLVYFNQAETEKDKIYYFERISKLIKKRDSEAFELLKSQYNYLSNWYYAAIRELVTIKGFNEDPQWIAKKLRNKVSKKEVAVAIENLIHLGMLKMVNGRLVQSSDIIRFSDNSLNYTVANAIHRELLEKAKDSLDEDSYEHRSASCVIMGTNSENFQLIREEIKAFRQHILNKYGTDTNNVDCVVNLSLQLNHLTEIDHIKH